jgi:hypothetical protein
MEQQLRSVPFVGPARPAGTSVAEAGADTRGGADSNSGRQRQRQRRRHQRWSLGDGVGLDRSKRPPALLLPGCSWFLYLFIS